MNASLGHFKIIFDSTKILVCFHWHQTEPEPSELVNEKTLPLKIKEIDWTTFSAVLQR